MLKRYLDLLVRFHDNRSSTPLKIISLTVGSLLFLFLLPGIFFSVALLTGLSFDIPRAVKTPLSLCATGTGLFFLCWATYAQLKIGGGSPAPTAPTEKLVIKGPYKYTRNPIQFGAAWYYLGFGMLAGTFYHGLVCMLLGQLFGTLYHKYIEEKELLIRFGEEYDRYRQHTPFLFPRFINNIR